MSNDNLGAILATMIMFTIGFLLGLALMYPRYGLSDEVENKLRKDAKINYRPEEKHIGYIISNYYKEVKRVESTEN